MRSAPAIGFEYRPSRLFAYLPALVLVLALIADVACALPWWAKLALAALALAVWTRAVRRPACPVVAAGWSAGDGQWSLRRADGGDVPATLASSRVLGPCIWLRLRTADRRIATLLLAPDNSDADIRRRLRIRLATMRDTPSPA